MQFQFSDIEHKYYPEFVEMVFSLYQEDNESEKMDRKKIEDTLFTLTKNPQKGRIVIIKADDIVIGYSILVFCWNIEYGGEILIIDDLYVKPSWRNRGLASQFFDSLVQEYKHKVVALKLEVSPSNSNAQRLYSRNGFIPSPNFHMIKIMKSNQTKI